MKLSQLATVTAFGVGTVLATTATAILVPACGGSDSTAPPASAPDGGSVGLKPPARPASAPAADTSKRQIFALRKLYLGETDRTSKRDPNAWKKFGYDLDDKNTKDPNAKDVCKPKGGPVV